MSQQQKIVPIVFSVFLLTILLFVGKPGVALQIASSSPAHTILLPAQPDIGSDQRDDQSLEHYDKPGYFSIFRFIVSFLPKAPRSN